MSRGCGTLQSPGSTRSSLPDASPCGGAVKTFATVQQKDGALADADRDYSEKGSGFPWHRGNGHDIWSCHRVQRLIFE